MGVTEVPHPSLTEHCYSHIYLLAFFPVLLPQLAKTLVGALLTALLSPPLFRAQLLLLHLASCSHCGTRLHVRTSHLSRRHFSPV